MSTLVSLGTYLPVWESGSGRACGEDEDAVTLAVAAGRAALGGDATRGPADEVARVVLVTRRPPLLDGANGAALLAGLGLPATTEVVEQLGGGPAALEALTSAPERTLVIGSDTDPGGAGAAAARTGPGGASVVHEAGLTRSLPVKASSADGSSHDYDDPRLARDQGAMRSARLVGLDEPPAAITGLAPRDAAALGSPGTPPAPTAGASAPLFALATLADSGRDGTVVAVEQATVTLATLGAGSVEVHRDERAPQPPLALRHHDGPELAIALAGYDRAFDAKLRLEAAQCATCGTLSYPPRVRCLVCGSEAPTTTVALPRDVEVYTGTTVRVGVPSMATPYSLVLVDLGSGVRLLAHVTGAVPGSVTIGDRGELVFRRVALRSGIPDYGYGFQPADRRLELEEVPA